MAKKDKIKRISINDFQKVMEENFNDNIKTLDWFGNSVTIKKFLSLGEVMSFVDDVISMCFTGDYDEDYRPEVKDFIIRSKVLEVYANFRLPSNLSDRYDLVMRTDAYDTVVAEIDERQFSNIITSIDEKLSIKNINNAKSLENKVDETCDALNSMLKVMEALFDGIEPDDIRTLSKSLAGGHSNEDVIATYNDIYNDTEDNTSNKKEAEE